MYQILADEVAAFNGLGAGGETFTNVMQALTPVINTAGQIAQTAINAKNNQNPNPTNTYTPVVYQTTTTPTVAPSNQPAQPKTWKDYLLWIALGGALAFGAYKMLTGKKKRR